MSASELRNIIEAALLAAGKSLTLNELSLLFDEQERPDPAAIRGAIESLAADYTARPIEINETGAGWRIQVRRAYGATVARLWPERPQRYSRALLERQWIRVVGHRDLPGRPELLGTTREFLEYFGLKNLDELPALTALRSLAELDPQLDLRVAGEADSACASSEPASAAVGGQIDEEPNDAEASEAEESGAAPQAAPGLVASPPDDS